MTGPLLARLLARPRGRRLCGTDDEYTTHAVIDDLLSNPETRELGAELAREACHLWRAAPVRLLPALVRCHREGDSGAVREALTTASISAEAVRAHGGLLAAVSITPAPRAAPCHGRTIPAYDSSTAAERLAALPVGVSRFGHAVETFGALLDAGPLTFRQAAQLYNLTFRWPGRMQALCAHLWLRHAGPDSAPRLLGEMVPHLESYAFGTDYLRGLARMGTHALPALPAVAALIDRRTRVPVNDSIPDAEMRIDEELPAAAVAARHAILAARDRPDSGPGPAV